jgi:hypothetical protein
MLKDHNLTTRTYKDKVAKEIYDRLPDYRGAFKKLLAQLKKLEE